MSNIYTINIDFEATDLDDADSRWDKAVDALCGCDPDDPGSCIDFTSALHSPVKEKTREYFISIDFEATDLEDADSRWDKAVYALCGCDPDSPGSCIDFTSSLSQVFEENGETIHRTPHGIRYQGNLTPSQELATGFVDSPLRGELEQYVGRLARHLPDDDGTIENVDEAPDMADITTELMAILLTTQESRFVIDGDGDAFTKAVDRKASTKIEQAERDMREQMCNFQRRQAQESSQRLHRWIRSRKRHLWLKAILPSHRTFLCCFVVCLLLGLLWLN